MTLPLRLRGEPYFSMLIGPHCCFILPSTQENKVCLAIHDAGIIAVVSNNEPPISISELLVFLGVTDISAVPKYMLVIPENYDEAYWVTTLTLQRLAIGKYSIYFCLIK